MRRETRDEILRGFLAINAVLRNEVKALRREIGVRSSEEKHNPNWALQARVPGGTPEGGRWVKLGGSPKGGGNRRPPSRHNRPPPDALVDVFPGLHNPVASAILAPIDGFLGLSSAADAASESATHMMILSLNAEIRRVDPSYQPSVLEPGGMPRTVEGRTRLINGLLMDRAAAIYRIRGDFRPLQVETLRFIQSRIDFAYRDAVRLYDAGVLPRQPSREISIGNRMDRTLRSELRRLFDAHRISWGPNQIVRVVGREYRTTSTDRTYRIPDARVGNVAFDWTLTRKSPNDSQIRGFFATDWGPRLVIIVRPNSVGSDTVYAITPPGN